MLKKRLARNLESKVSVAFSGLAVFTFAFLTALLSGSHFAPVSDGSAAPVSTILNATGYYANITSSGSLSLTLNTTPTGAYGVIKDSLSVDTNTTTGYKLYISTIDHSSDIPSLPSGTPSNGLIDSASGSYLSPSTGAADTPVRLAVNTWGYVPSRATFSETPTVYTDSDAAPTEAKGGKSIWRAVPEYGDEDIFYTNTSPSASGSNSIDIYYGVSANTALPSGTYSNTVLYTAIVDGGVNAEGEEGASISPDRQDGLDSGQEVTIATSLYPGFNTSNLGDITVKIGDNDCTDITPVLTEIGSLNLTCTAPAQTSYGKYVVTVAVNKYNKTYALANAYEYALPKFFTITTMQEMTHEICTDTRVPTPTLSTMTNIITKDNYAEDAKGTPQTTLKDSRDGKEYTVRKFGDGKCWMVSNLRYAPSSATVLSQSTDAGQKSDIPTTDIDSSFSYTIPALGVYNSGNTDYSGNEVYEGSYGSTYGATYYSWYTATAGTGIASMSNGWTTSSICPRNWRLPTGGDGAGTTGITTAGSNTNLENGDLRQLDFAFGGNGAEGNSGGRANWANATYGFNATLVGRFDGNTAVHGNQYGNWWSSSVSASNMAWRLCINASAMYPYGYYYKGASFALRCVAR